MQQTEKGCNQLSCLRVAGKVSPGNIVGFNLLRLTDIWKRIKSATFCLHKSFELLDLQCFNAVT